MMKKLFGNPKLIKKNKQAAHTAKLEDIPKEKEYAVLVECIITESIWHSSKQTLKVCAFTEDEAKDVAEDTVCEGLTDNEEVETITSKVVAVDLPEPKDDKTIDMFQKNI